jgi:hypothetical protein
MPQNKGFDKKIKKKTDNKKFERKNWGKCNNKILSKFETKNLFKDLEKSA